jgi:hypothetical protein
MKIEKYICDYCGKETSPIPIADPVQIKGIGTLGIYKRELQGADLVTRLTNLCPTCSAVVAKLWCDSFRMEVEEAKDGK